jgi:hypothetical protein
MSTIKTIKVQFDLGIFEGLLDGHEADESASLNKYAELILDALRAAYPEARIEVSCDPRTSGGDSIEILDAEGDTVSYRETDAVREVINAVWARFDWFVPSDSPEAA